MRSTLTGAARWRPLLSLRSILLLSFAALSALLYHHHPRSTISSSSFSSTSPSPPRSLRLRSLSHAPHSAGHYFPLSVAVYRIQPRHLRVRPPGRPRTVSLFHQPSIATPRPLNEALAAISPHLPPNLARSVHTLDLRLPRSTIITLQLLHC